MKKFMIHGIRAFCGLALTVSLSVSAFAANLTVAEVTASELNLRAGSGTQYEILDRIERGASVVVESTENGWSKITYNGLQGYVSSSYLKMTEAAPAPLGKGILTGDLVCFRTQPSLDCEVIAQLRFGSVVEVLGVSGDWYQVSYQNRTGYLYRDYVSLSSFELQEAVGPSAEGAAVIPAEQSAEAPAEQSAEAPAEQPAEQTSETAAPQSGGAGKAANAAAELAQELLGLPYVWGGSNPDTGFDCSGLVQYCYSKNSVSIERTASAQYRQGTQVEKSELLPGDLVFFAGTRGWYVDHVGIYIGDGKFVHASSGKGKLVIAELSNVYFAHYYYGACRVSE